LYRRSRSGLCVGVPEAFWNNVINGTAKKKFLGGRAKFGVSNRVGQSPGGRSVVVPPEADDFAVIRCRILVTG